MPTANISELTAAWECIVNGIIELKEVYGVICSSKYRDCWRQKYCYLCEPRIQKAVAISLVVGQNILNVMKICIQVGAVDR